MSNIIGKPIDRKDGILKVTGKATYAYEWPVKNVAYGVTFQSSITKGHISNFDLTAAQNLKGVLGIMTYKNAMSLHHPDGSPGSGRFSEKDLLPLQSERIFYNGQHIGVVIAETFEIAEHAASLIKVTYSEEKPVFDINQQDTKIYQPGHGQEKRGDAESGMNDATVKLEETYITPVYHHNAMEPHATTAVWDGDELTIYDSTQSVFGTRNGIASILGIPKEKVHVISPFIGGGFGSKGFIWANTLLAPMAAKLVKRPVKIALTRTFQMFTCAGRRSTTIQKINFGAGKNGKISSAKHDTTAETSFVDEFIEQAGLPTKMLYDFKNLEVVQNLARLNKGTPTPTRAPGEAPGTYALEVAMDELAYQLDIDPLELRLINYAEKNPEDGKEFSGKNLKECYEKGAASIGWSQRNKTAGVTKEGNYLIGYGMATATYPANQSKASVKLRLYQDGHAVAACCTQDIGTGTYTVMAQVMADALGLPINKVQIKLGDSNYPQGPGSGGSQTMATTGPAVQAAALTVKSKVINFAIADKKSPLFSGQKDDIVAENGRLFIKSDPSKGETYTQILKRSKIPVVETEVSTNVSTRQTKKEEPNPVAKKQAGKNGGGSKDESENNPFVRQEEDIPRQHFAFHSFGAYFAKVKVDSLTGKVKVEKIVGVMDVGRILNEKTAKSQIMGGAIFGIGMALMEESIYDPNTGRIVTKDLAEYHLPVHADIPEFDIQFTDKPDLNLSLIGARGAGEIGITGITAAIVNAVYHATGKRVRDIPITPDKLIS